MSLLLTRKTIIVFWSQSRMIRDERGRAGVLFLSMTGSTSTQESRLLVKFG